MFRSATRLLNNSLRMSTSTATNSDILTSISHKRNPKTKNTRKTKQANWPTVCCTAWRHAYEICTLVWTYWAWRIALIYYQIILSWVRNQLRWVVVTYPGKFTITCPATWGGGGGLYWPWPAGWNPWFWGYDWGW